MVAKRIEFILLLVYLITNLINLNKIYISSDHAGFKLKEKIKYSLKKKKLKIFDLGPSNDNSVDYPDFAKKLAKSVAKSKKNRGILVCGSGVGMSMVANKVKNIRALIFLTLFATIDIPTPEPQTKIPRFFLLFATLFANFFAKSG